MDTLNLNTFIQIHFCHYIMVGLAFVLKLNPKCIRNKIFQCSLYESSSMWQYRDLLVVSELMKETLSSTAEFINQWIFCSDLETWHIKCVNFLNIAWIDMKSLQQNSPEILRKNCLFHLLLHYLWDSESCFFYFGSESMYSLKVGFLWNYWAYYKTCSIVFGTRRLWKPFYRPLIAQPK